MLSASMGLACRRTQAPDRVAAESCSLHGVCTCSCPIKLGWMQLESELDVELKALQPNYMHYSCGLGRRNLRKSALPWFRTEHQIQGRQRNVSASGCNNSPLLRFVQNLLLATGAALEVSTKEQKPRSGEGTIAKSTSQATRDRHEHPSGGRSTKRGATACLKWQKAVKYCLATAVVAMLPYLCRRGKQLVPWAVLRHFYRPITAHSGTAHGGN